MKFRNSLFLPLMLFNLTFWFGIGANEGCMGSPTCDCQRLETSKRIIGGKKADVHEYPFQVHITSVYTIGRRKYAEVCGATLISSEWILTAAHCVTNERAEGILPDVKVRLGEHITNSKTETDKTEIFYTSDVTVHEGYSTRSGIVNDIALIKLEEPVSFSDAVSPACLPIKDEVKEKKFKGEKVLALGWGRHDRNYKNTSDTLKKLDMRAYSTQNCVYPKSNWEYGKLNDNMLCGYNPGKNVCHGDSGGPLVYDEDGHSYVIGVASFVYGPRCVYYGFPAIFVRVASYIDWIEDITGEEFCSV